MGDNWLDLSRDDKIAILRAGVNDRMSARDIGDQYGVTRNTILGFAHRNKIRLDGYRANGRGKTEGPDRVKRIRSNVPKSRTSKPAIAISAIPAPPIHPDPLMLPLDQLDAHMCRYPIGDPKYGAFGFCGLPIERGSYCREHYEICYTRRDVT